MKKASDKKWCKNCGAKTYRTYCRPCEQRLYEMELRLPKPGPFIEAALAALSRRQPTPLEEAELAMYLAECRKAVKKVPRYRDCDGLPEETEEVKYSDIAIRHHHRRGRVMLYG